MKKTKDLIPDVRITNPRRKKRIVEFVDKNHKVMIGHYELIDQDLTEARMQKAFEKMIKEDADFYDPYINLADIYEAQGKKVKARKLISIGFERAMKRIVDSEGNFPEILEWGWLENRHIIRIIFQQALDLWTLSDTESSLYLYRNLLRSNPNDNIGARFDILAILLSLKPAYLQKFELKDNPGFMDGGVISDWFEKNSKKFPEEFDWWWEYVEFLD